MNFKCGPIIGPQRSSRFPFRRTWDRFRLPLPNGNFSVVLASLQANYSINRFLTFTSLVQMDTSNTQASQRQPSPEIQLPARQRSLHHLQRRNAVRQHRAGQSSSSPRDSLRCEMDLFFLALTRT